MGLVVALILLVALVSTVAAGTAPSSTRDEPASAGAAVSDTPDPSGTPDGTTDPSADPSATDQETTVADLQWSQPPALTIDPTKDLRAIVRTDRGDITIQLFAEQSPRTVNNFVFLAGQGFYDGVIFHRVIRGFMIQGGDPTGTGRGGPGYRFDDELSAARVRGYTRGIVAMANAGPNTNGSQFFIMHADYGLPPAYSVFGEVLEGLEVVDAIATTATDGSDRPLEQVTIRSVEIVEG
jgi:cyclophilin family peptidyl-prolyl cis-trans isomerase